MGSSIASAMSTCATAGSGEGFCLSGLDFHAGEHPDDRLYDYRPTAPTPTASTSSSRFAATS